MKKNLFKTVEFITSALSVDEYPQLKKKREGTLLPEIIVVGRSNVGKSSFINHLSQIKNLAKVSSTPGKTQRMQFFLIDQTFLLVDLPGYGFAKTSKQIQKQWGRSLEEYLNQRPLKAILFLIDTRRTLTKDDLTFLKWVQFKQITLIPILTKSDKLSPQEQKKSFMRLKEDLWGYPPLLYSIKQGKCRDHLIHILHQVIWD